MADRLSKLSQYLGSQNYELAIECHQANNYKIDNLDENQIIKLAKAYHFINSDYEKTIKILNQVKQWKSLGLYFQSSILIIKSGYLGSLIPLQKINSIIKEVMIRIKTQLKQWAFYQKILDEIIQIINNNHNHSHKYNVSNAALEQERKQLQQLLKQEDDNSIIMEGMPKFIISGNWLKKWVDYTQTKDIQKQKKYPGPITQFQIIDHIFNIFYDKTQGKQYTNKYIFAAARYQILPKKCWIFLKQRYGGIDLKRFNITFINKPNDIMTQVFLKKIEIARYMDADQKDLKFVWIQITRKQTWQGLTNKLATIWNSGQIHELQRNKTKAVNESEILQETDTVGKKYIFKPLTKKNEKNQQKCAFKECKNTQKLKFCECKSVKYCSSQCQKDDRSNHRNKCEKQKSYINQQSVSFKSFNLQQKDYGGMKGKVGLKNLGNTCYMNSGLQCLSNTKQITQYFMKDQFKSHINYKNPLGMKGNFACTYAELIRQMWTGTSQVVSPFKIKKLIGNYSTQFSGYGQQDSQQLISLLIDILCEDLNLVKNKETFEVGDEIKPDEEMSRQSQMNYAKRIQSYIRNLMAGQFKSTVTCSVCQRISVCFDPFLLITMPIPSSHEGNFYFISTDLAKGAVKFKYEYNATITLQILGKQLISAYNKSIEFLRSSDVRSSKIDFSKSNKLTLDKLYFVLVDRSNFAVVKELDLSEKIINLRNIDAQLMCLQIPSIISKDEQIFLVQFIYKDKKNRQERCNLPKFFKLPKQSNPKLKQQLIIQCLGKGFKQQRTTYQESIYDQKIVSYGRRFKNYEIYCRKQFKLKVYSQSINTYNIGKLIQIKSHATLDDCMNSFIQLQNLTGQNTWYCSKCKKHQQATKHMEIYKSNKILVIAFKRFTRLNKIRTPVNFPLQNFDIGPYLLSNKNKQKVLYDLYGVVNHYGTLGGGHYTAYCQNFLTKRWYQFNDSRVSQINRNQIVSGDSYVLFYRRKD